MQTTFFLFYQGRRRSRHNAEATLSPPIVAHRAPVLVLQHDPSVRRSPRLPLYLVTITVNIFCVRGVKGSFVMIRCLSRKSKEVM